MSMLTGESVPVEVRPGDAVVGATVNAGGRLVVRATRVGADTRRRSLVLAAIETVGVTFFGQLSILGAYALVIVLLLMRPHGLLHHGTRA